MYLTPDLLWQSVAPFFHRALPQWLHHEIFLSGTGNCVWLTQAVLGASSPNQDSGRFFLRDDSSKDADGKLSLRGDFWVTSMGESNGEWGARRDQYVSDSVVLHWAKIKIKGLA